MLVSNDEYRIALVEAAERLIAKGRKVFGISSNKIPFPNCKDCAAKPTAAHRDECPCLRDPMSRCHSFYSATDDIDIVKAWIEETPTMQLAVATGKASGVFVFEYDPKNGGDATYQELVREHGAISTETNMSPSGGLHHVFALPNFDVSNIIGRLFPGIDIKGEGGYHLVPPSPDYSNVSDEDPSEPPKWLREAIFDYQARTKWTEGSRTLQPVEKKEYDPESISEDTSSQVAKTVNYWTNKIKFAPPGRQNIYLYTGARVLFSLCYHGLLDDLYAEEVLEQAAAEGNHPAQRVFFALASARAEADSNPDPVDEALSDDRDIIETFQQNDIGNANRVVFWKGSDIRYDPDREQFYTWNKKKWIEAREGRVLGLVEDVISKIDATEADFYSDVNCPPDEKNKTRGQAKSYRVCFKEWASKQQFTGKIQSCSALLKGREALWGTSDDFDVNPFHFNVANGVIDLSSGELLPHDRHFMCSAISNVTYDPDATAPEFERFMRLTQPKASHRKYLQRLMGLTLLGEVRDQIFALHIGSGGNGKGVFLDTMSYLIGEYATTGQRDTFVRKSSTNRIPADLASYEGKRIVVVDELNENQKFDTALLKDATGGGKIKAEAKNVNPWEYTPKFTLHFRTNHMPDLPSDRSIVRRFRPVLWTVEPSPNEWDSFTSPHHSTPFNYLTKREASGILNWLLQGTRDYLQNGLQVPEDLQIEAIQMLEENDPFLIFMRGHTEIVDHQKIDGSTLYRAYKDWYSDHYPGQRPSTSKSIYTDVRAGKYKDRWEHTDERGRLVFLNLQLVNHLTLR